jgi:Holliday junction resolvasome RuvABC endonuclease subunit
MQKMERSNLQFILTNDPSFTAWGWAIVDERGKVYKSGCIKTTPEQKKRRIRVSDDRTRRTEEITKYLLNLISDYGVTYLLSEAPHGSQNASAAVMIGIVIGVLVGISETLNIPIEWYSEQDSKKCLLGKKAATKDDIVEAIDRLYEVDWTKTKYIDEAVVDALAVHYVASKQSQILKYMKR